MTRDARARHDVNARDSHDVAATSTPSPSAVTTSSSSTTTPTRSSSTSRSEHTTTTPPLQPAVATHGDGATGSVDEGEAVSIRSLHMRRDWYTSLATFVAGGVAGASSRTLTAPLDRMKILVQEGHLVGHSAASHVTATASSSSSSGVHTTTTPHAATAPLSSPSCARPSCATPATAARATSTMRAAAAATAPRRNATLLDAARLIVADGGWRSFWRGNLVNCFKAGPEFAIVFALRRYLFSLYEDCIAREQQQQVQQLQLALQLQQHDEQQRRQLDVRDGVVQRVPLLVVNCTIGAVAGLVAQSVLYPMELVKTRVVVSRTSEYTGGVREVVRAAYRVGGVREFFRGFAPNMVGIIVYRGLEMGLYSSTQQSLMLYRMQWQHKSRHDAALSTAEVGAVGMFASIIAQTVSYPLNVVRTRLQTQGVNGRHHAYHGMVDCFAKMVRHAGVRSLFSGLSANYLKAVPASACTFIVFEKMQQLLVGDN